jgi:hypothetical protein
MRVSAIVSAALVTALPTLARADDLRIEPLGVTIEVPQGGTWTVAGGALVSDGMTIAPSVERESCAARVRAAADVDGEVEGAPSWLPAGWYERVTVRPGRVGFFVCVALDETRSLGAFIDVVGAEPAAAGAMLVAIADAVTTGRGTASAGERPRPWSWWLRGPRAGVGVVAALVSSMRVPDGFSFRMQLPMRVFSRTGVGAAIAMTAGLVYASDLDKRDVNAIVIGDLDRAATYGTVELDAGIGFRVPEFEIAFLLGVQGEHLHRLDPSRFDYQVGDSDADVGNVQLQGGLSLRVRARERVAVELDARVAIEGDMESHYEAACLFAVEGHPVAVSAFAANLGRDLQIAHGAYTFGIGFSVGFY